jgi:hypothetical protein
MVEKSIVNCTEPSLIKDLNIDEPPPYCSEADLDCNNQPIHESQKDVSGRDFSWLEQETLQKIGVGQNALCDPILKGHIVNEQGGTVPAPNRNVVYRYSKALRGCDEGVWDMFRDIVVLDEQGTYHNVPIILGTPEKAVAAIVSENFRKDNSLVVDRIRLPMMALHPTDVSFNPKRYVYHKAIDYLRDYKNNYRPGFAVKEKYERDTVFGVSAGIPLDKSYTLYVWTMHREDMNQIAEQIMPKIMPMGYIRVRGVSWEIGVKLISVANNIEVDSGDKAVPIYKYQFNITAETYLPQPIVRKKAVLKTRTEIVDSIEDNEIADVISRLEEAVKELQ